MSAMKPNCRPFLSKLCSDCSGMSGVGHPDTQAIFTSVASFNALTKSDTIQRVFQPFPSKSRFQPIPERTFGFNVTMP
jgi:hypothetical protein